MILVTHGIVGGGLGAVLPGGPIVSFLIGFVSHFILDAIPHWDYKLGSISGQNDDKVGFKVKDSPTLLVDMAKVSIDGLSGLIVPMIFFLPAFGMHLWLSILAGAIGAILPDFLQFVYARREYRWLYLLQAFHDWVHSDRRLRHIIIGPALQFIPILIILVAVFL